MKKKKFLTVLQMWEGDAEAACSLARLLADIQGGAVNQETDLMLLYRQDCRPRPKLELYCQDVFANVHVLSTRRKDAGFPAGPNAMWCELMQHAEIMHKLGKWDYTAVLTTEGDACPLTKDWSAKLLAAWEEANAPVAGCWMPGSFSQSADIGHINGNAMFDVALAQKIPQALQLPAAALLGHVLLKGFSQTRLERSSGNPQSLPGTDGHAEGDQLLAGVRMRLAARRQRLVGPGLGPKEPGCRIAFFALQPGVQSA